MAEEMSPLENHGWWMEQLRKDAKANRTEPPPEPIHGAKIHAEFLDIERHTLPGEMTIEDWFEAGVRFAERQHEIV